MPPRLSRRQQRQIEELEELESQLSQKESVDVEQSSAQGIGFSAVRCWSKILVTVPNYSTACCCYRWRYGRRGRKRHQTCQESKSLWQLMNDCSYGLHDSRKRRRRNPARQIQSKLQLVQDFPKTLRNLLLFGMRRRQPRRRGPRRRRQKVTN